MKSNLTRGLSVFLIACLLALIATQIGCSSSRNLSRSEAASLLSKSKEFVKGDQSFSWRQGRGLEAFNSQGGFRNPKIKTAIAKAERFSVVFANPMKRKVDEVTGIADPSIPVGNESMKEVQFTWSYEDQPSIAKRFINIGGVGKALFRRFDDGWRVEEVSFTSTPGELTERDRADIKKDQDQENDRRAKYIFARQKKITELNNLIATSQQNPRQIATFPLSFSLFRGIHPLTVTDKNVTFFWASVFENKTLWYGCIDKIQAGSGGTIWRPGTKNKASVMSEKFVYKFLRPFPG